jgi:hypothetical protein
MIISTHGQLRLLNSTIVVWRATWMVTSIHGLAQLNLSVAASHATSAAAVGLRLLSAHLAKAG